MDQNDTERNPKTRPETKYSIRKKVWYELLKQKASVFPPPFQRIPNFKGAQEATKKLSELTEYLSAKSVEVNPDKPLEFCRRLVLEDNKELYVPVPGLRQSLLKKLEKDEKTDLTKIVSRWGIQHTGKAIGLEDKIQLDLLVVGSVAVSRDGLRIGKGKGFADLEFAILKELQFINDNTTIVTIVHDLQVFDTLPNDLFKQYDIPVDYIITPTEVIKTKSEIQKPQGLYWNILTPKRLSSIEILQKLRKMHVEEGRDVTLKTLEHKRKKSGNRSRRTSEKRYSGTRDVENGNRSNTPNQSGDEPLQNTDRLPKKIRVKKSSKSPKIAKPVPLDGNAQNGKENIENVPPKLKKQKKMRKNPGYSLLVSNIQRGVRVRDLKNALSEKGIKPTSITWKGFRGYCYLHYSAKVNKKVGDENENNSFGIDNVIEMIQKIKVNSDSEQNLNVKVMEPITRIETLDVTAV